MNILTSSIVLDLSGTPTYTLTMVRELERRGHQVTVYSPGGGALVGEMCVVSSLDGLDEPDVILAQHEPCAEDLHARFPDTQLIFSSHGVLPEVDQPPPFKANWYMTINEDGRDNLVSKGVDPERIDIVRDIVDTDRFRPNGPLKQKLERVLFISNFKKWKTYAVIEQACRRLGLKLKACGSPYGRCKRIWETINQADIIISVGRGILEGMACGRPVVSFNQMRGDGYLTPDLYLESRTRNFAGENCRYSFDVNGLVAELGKYDPMDGPVNRSLILEHHDHRYGVDRILEVINKVL